MGSDHEHKGTGEMRGLDGADRAEASDDAGLAEADLEDVAAGRGPAEWFPRWTCLFCPEVFRSERQLIDHMEKAHGHKGKMV
ncbi:MAG TPA: hypothetical protein VIK93_09270 [Limnochordales bacterium]